MFVVGITAGNEAERAPSGTFTNPGITAMGGIFNCHVERITTAPPGGAAPFRRTSKLIVFPPTTTVASENSDCRLMGSTFSAAVFVLTPLCAVMETGVDEDTGRV